MTSVTSEFRKSLQKNVGGQLHSIEDGDFIIYCPGTKKPTVVNIMLKAAISAGTAQYGKRLVLGFKKHPGEKSEKPEEQELFEKCFAERKDILAGVATLVIPEKESNARLVGAANMTIFTGGPTESIVAAYARKRCVYYTDAEVRAFLVKSGVDGGVWFVGEPGYAGALKAEGYEGLASAITALSSSEGCSLLHKTQEKNFPPPETWDTAPHMVKFLTSVAR